MASLFDVSKSLNVEIKSADTCTRSIGRKRRLWLDAETDLSTKHKSEFGIEETVIGELTSDIQKNGTQTEHKRNTEPNTNGTQSEHKRNTNGTQMEKT